MLGKNEDAQRFDELFERIKAAFNKAYVSPEGRIKSDSQTSYTLALAFDLLPADKRAAAAGFLVENIKSRDMHLSTGFNGTAYLMPTLAATGHNDVAYRLLLNDTFPSWGYSIKHGATTIWERWDGWTAEKGFQDPGMNSFAHYSFGAVARWMFQTVAGIDTAEPGFQRLRISPRRPAAGLTWVKADYGSIHGRIASAWRIEDDKFTMDITIPANTTATVTIPVSNLQAITEGGRPIADVAELTLVSAVGDTVVLRVPAGTYRFVAPWKAGSSPGRCPGLGENGWAFGPEDDTCHNRFSLMLPSFSQHAPTYFAIGNASGRRGAFDGSSGPRERCPPARFALGLPVTFVGRHAQSQIAELSRDRRSIPYVAFRSAKERHFRRAKGDNATVVDSPLVCGRGSVCVEKEP